MDKTEFISWCKILKSRLPDTGAWLAKQDETTKAYWFEILGRHSYDDCVKSIDGLMADGFNSYERERLPAQISKLAADIGYQKTEAARSYVNKRRSRQKGTVADGIASTLAAAGVSNAFQAIVTEQRRRKQEGLPPLEGAEREAFIDALLPDDCPYDEPRYKCLDCLDSGFVSGRDSQSRHITYGCTCAAGDKRVEAFRASGRKLGRQLQHADFGEYAGN